MNVQVSMPSSK